MIYMKVLMEFADVISGLLKKGMPASSDHGIDMCGLLSVRRWDPLQVEGRVCGLRASPAS